MRFGANKIEPGHFSHLLRSVSGQTLIALSFNLISLLAGGLISLFTPAFSDSPWILALFPAVLTIRGGIGGIFSGNLATMLHLGLIEKNIIGNTEDYNSLVKSVFVITVFDTLVLGGISFAFNLFLGKATLSQLPIFLCVPCVTCVMAISLSLPITSLLAFETFKRGLDPDILVYPILASMNDLIVTLFFVLTVYSVLIGGWAWITLGFIFLILLTSGIIISWRNRSRRAFRQTLREGALVVVFSSIFGSMNGIFLSNIQSLLTNNPGLVVMYPALTNALGNIGSIIGSTSTTEMALGLVGDLRSEFRKLLGSILQVEGAAALIHVVFALLSYIIARYQGAKLVFLISVALISNISSFMLISVFAVIVAFTAFQRGLNPDNVVIPAITSTSDTVATLTLVPAAAISLLAF